MRILGIRPKSKYFWRLFRGSLLGYKQALNHKFNEKITFTHFVNKPGMLHTHK